jgi:hypothetical protein
LKKIFSPKLSWLIFFLNLVHLLSFFCCQIKIKQTHFTQSSLWSSREFFFLFKNMLATPKHHFLCKENSSASQRSASSKPSTKLKYRGFTISFSVRSSYNSIVNGYRTSIIIF